jgi:hypothetical protein
MKSFKQYIFEIAMFPPPIETVHVEKVKEEKPPAIVMGDNKNNSSVSFSIPKETKKDDQKTTDAFEGSDILKNLYGSFASAEHRGLHLQNPFAFDKRTFIRTTGSTKSTAYGPVQITLGTLQGFIKTNPKLFAGNEDFIKQYVDQGLKFKSAKAKDKIYGLGCVGDMCDPKFNENYQKMAVGVIKGKLKEQKIDTTKPLSPEELTKAIRSWRGVSEAEDPVYYKTVRDAYSKMGAAKQDQNQPASR